MSIDKYTRPEEVPGFLLWSVSKKWQNARQNSLKQIGLSHIEFVVLAHLLWLSHKEKYVTQHMLSEWIYVDKVSVSITISSLEKKELVIRKSNPKDNRSYYLHVTEQGEKIAISGIKTVKETNRSFFSPLGEKKDDLVQLLQILLKTQIQTTE